jgi:hypothetical protein
MEVAMIEKNDPVFAELRRSEMPPLSAPLRARALAIARTSLSARRKRSWSLGLADYRPPVALVPSLLISAGVVFVFDAILRLAHMFRIS